MLRLRHIDSVYIDTQRDPQQPLLQYAPSFTTGVHRWPNTPNNIRFMSQPETIQSSNRNPQQRHLEQEIARRRTFAIISHPDAGKTTLTEKFLLYGGAIQQAGAVKAKRATRHATSDWMALEQARGISVTSSVMQFDYGGRIVNLLDTPGHADFSEDTYRTLTAVDSALMVIDVAKGVEARTIKLMEICRMRQTPIFTFVNKLDREGRPPLEILDEVEDVLGIECAPVTWPVGMGRRFRGVYHLLQDEVLLFETGRNYVRQDARRLQRLDSPELAEAMGPDLAELQEEIELVREASPDFDRERYLAGQQTPVFFGSALNNFGVAPLLDEFVEHAPPPRSHATTGREVSADEAQFTGFVFKIQANMDPKHRDRIAFLRVCSGRFERGMKLFQVRQQKALKAANALTFMAASRDQADEAFPGDIVGLPNHGTIAIGDTLTEGEVLQFTGIPNFAPELFKRVRLKDPLRYKQLRQGLAELAEEGATQFFKPILGNDLILGAVGPLQFDVCAWRLKHEYQVEAVFEAADINTVRWVHCDDPKMMEDFQRRHQPQLAEDHAGQWVYLAPSRANLTLVQERWPEIDFAATRETLLFAE